MDYGMSGHNYLRVSVRKGHKLLPEFALRSLQKKIFHNANVQRNTRTFLIMCGAI